MPFASIRLCLIVAISALISSFPDNGVSAQPVVAAAKKAAASCASVAPDSATSAAFKVVAPKILCAKGTFDLASMAKMKAIANPASIRYLVVDSGGGIVLPAIRLAELAELHQWLVVVSGHCHSSCANYVFLAKTPKVVLPDSYVSWHGLPPSPQVAGESFDQHYANPEAKAFADQLGFTREQMLAFMVLNASESQKFFRKRVLSEDLARKQPLATNLLPKEYAEQFAKAIEAGPISWTYSKRALTRKWRVRKILSMWEPTDRQIATATLKQRHGWWMFFLN